MGTTVNNRLLSEQEIIDILGWPTMPDYELHQATAAAQLTKTDKEWVEWGERTISECRACTCKYMTPDCEIIKTACMAWQERKKEIGL